MKSKITKPTKAIFMDHEKEAKFWEENFDEAWKKGKPVKVVFSKNLSETINIRLDPQILDIVRTEAQKKGLGPTQIIRMWIMEKVGNKYVHAADLG
ncbi:MAG TPA: CopG family antitoxin [Candidatus Saccharimonadales bacterium]|nr:CopG family antitoxin [Candidatus Saccharimonadales bacterium]